MTPSLLRYRSSGLPPELRDGRRLVAYFAVFDQVSDYVLTEDGRRFREIIRPGAFRRSLAAHAPVYACVEHDKSRTFATRDSGLLLQEDARGLFGSVYLGTTSEEERVLAAVEGGTLLSCSIGFWLKTSTIRTTPGGADGLDLDEVLDADLFDVTLTAQGVYRQTEAGLRAVPAVAGCPAADPLAERLRILKCRR